MQYRVYSNPKLPEFVPLSGWRRWAAKLGFRVQRERMIVQRLDELACNPANLPYLQKYLTVVGDTYELQRAPLAVLTGGAGEVRS